MIDGSVPSTDTQLDRSHVHDFMVEVIMLDIIEISSEVLEFATEYKGQTSEEFRTLRRKYLQLYLSVLHKLPSDYEIPRLKMDPLELVSQAMEFVNWLRKEYGYLPDGLQTIKL